MKPLYDDRHIYWPTWPYVLGWCALGLLGWALLAGVAYLFMVVAAKGT